jgi:hypothetical protein
MRKRGLPSPDEGDAVSLCFASIEGFGGPKGFGREIIYPKGYAGARA